MFKSGTIEKASLISNKSILIKSSLVLLSKFSTDLAGAIVNKSGDVAESL